MLRMTSKLETPNSKHETPNTNLPLVSTFNYHKNFNEDTV
jgi:hypothetical protein